MKDKRVWDFEFITWHTGAFIAGLSLLNAGASVEARRRVAGQVARLTVFPIVLCWALASVAAHFVDAQPAVFTEWRLNVALIDVLFAGLSREERRARANEEGLKQGATATIRTWI